MFKLQLKIQGTYQVSWTPPSLPLSDGIWWHLMSQVAQSRDPPHPHSGQSVHRHSGELCSRFAFNSVIFTLFHPHIKQMRIFKAVSEEVLS